MIFLKRNKESGTNLKLKTLILIISALLPSAVVLGKESSDTISARRAFIEMPETVLDLISADMRLDMLDHYDADSVGKGINTLRGEAAITQLTPDFINVDLTGVSTLQYKIFRQKNGSDVLLSIYTVGEKDGERDSEIIFYDSNLSPLKTDKFIKKPQLSDFFDLKGYKTKMKEIEELIPFYNISYEASPGSNEVRAKLSFGDAMPLEDLKLIEMFLNPEIIYIWNGKELKR